MSFFKRLFGRHKDEPQTEEEAQQEEAKVEQSLEKSRSGIFGRIAELFSTSEPITDELWDELEELLIQGDVGVETTMYLVDRTKDRVNRNGVKRASEAREMLQAEMVSIFQEYADQEESRSDSYPHIIMVVGVNGSGKTTLIAKLAHRYQSRFGKRVLLAAGDTFRAAASEQLEIWAQRTGVRVISRGQGADAGAVVYDAVEEAVNGDYDILIIDTAGRLHAKFNLMKELEKLRNVVRRKVTNAPHEVLLVIDATTGQNGVLQAKAFLQSVDVTDVVVTKLDGTAKGGIALAISQDIQRPIRYIGTGETMDDLAMFDAESFVEALFARE
ncbi:MAG: signal recognition particle-docking protein FtsY [Chloroflexaceae bacterium]|nr:signal recognition particle-docking protein FtsY [Chloroflexaceae bacterium]